MRPVKVSLAGIGIYELEYPVSTSAGRTETGETTGQTGGSINPDRQKRVGLAIQRKMIIGWMGDRGDL